MKTRLLILCLGMLVFWSPVFARTIETQHFSEIKSYVTKETLVLLDIDDTLIIPEQMLGCDRWFLHRVSMHIDEGEERKEALERAIAEWQAVRFLTKMELVEAGTDVVVRELQDQGYTVMGLTTQGLALATQTVRQLHALGIDLSRTAPSSEDIYQLVQGRGVLYRQGILFTAGSSKGAALMGFCERIKIKPSRIVFINDKSSHLGDVEQVVQACGIEFIGLRYAFADERKSHFRSDVADFQFAHSSLSQLLSDEAALNKMAEMRKVD